MTKSEILVIGRSSLHDQTPLKEKYLPFAFLERLLMLDYRARELIVKDDNYESGITEDDFSNTEGEREIPSDLENFISKGENDNNTHQIQQAHIHPMDVQMAVFHCADNFLRQYIVTKLSMCQYALPLLVPNPITGKIDFPLWTFRQIIKSWKASNSNTVNSSCMPIYKAKTPMVFFFRLGPVSVSKSHKSRLILDGVVEIAWYCPSGKDDDIFNDCIAFCNLHGNAEEHQEQKNSLTDASSVNVVFLPDFNLDDNVKSILQKLLTSPKPLICLLADAELSLTRVCGNKYKVGLKNRNQAELTQELTKTIQHYLKLSNHTFCLQEYADIAKKNGFRLDEENKDCTKAKLCAKKIIDILKSVKLSKIKEQFLPCQGRLWHDWCEKNKDLHRLHGNIEQTRSKIEEEIKNIRRKQRDFGLHNLMKTFVRNLQTEKPVQKMFFLKWLGILIDEHCSDQLSELHHIYDAKWSEVLDLKQKHDKSDELKNKQVELETISEQLNSAVFGLEHVLREMGQIYEAWESQPDRAGMDIYSFPALAAEIMISGYPIELMDGDAAHVPLKWIDSVLGKVIERLGDQRVFVLSVLGLQSTGKSTMLNAMFGLQFAVSAGRCTRGAFMQLVKVNEEVKEELQFDYMLVVDTEGLRALELAGKSTLNHDNELATFVIGLGNMTLINIFGENPAEMQDILQISVQAFLRMKKVRLTPSCMFVHQNVGEITAGEKNMEGKRRLQEKLDEMACLAAKEEVCDVVQFNDVIKFDVKRDVQYFAQLWEGNPPMAPPNPRYSENVQELKQIILSNGAQHKSLNLSEFKFRIKDLWRALLNENFVFSFKNTLEITTYRKLERMYGNWTWKLRSAMLAIENKLHNRIENGKLETVDRSYLIQEITATFENVRREMENFFAEDVDKEMLVEWRGKTELKIEDLKNDLIEGTKRKFDELIQLKSSCKRLDNEKTQYENQLFNKSKEMASALRNKGNDTSDLKKEFDSLWKQWVLSLTSKIPQIKDIDIEEDVMKTLFAFYEERFVKHSKEHRYYKNICIIGDYKDYVKMNRTKRSLGFASYSLKPEDHHSIRNLIQDIVRETEDYIKHKLIAKISYSDSYIYEIVKTITTRITEFESNIKRFVFTKDFNVDVTLFVCDIAVLKFTDLQMAFREANDPLIYLGSKKEDYYSIFKKFFQGATSATVFADFICSKLKPSILQTVYDKTAIDVAGDMRANFPAFSGNRSNLEKHILLVLAEEENFAKFMNYIDNPKKHFKEFITQCVNEHFFKGKDSSLFKMIIHTFQSLFKEEDFSILDIFKQNLELKQRCVSEAISISTVGVKNKNGDVQMWLNTFSSQLADELKFTEKDLKGVLYPDIKDFDFLQEEMTVALQNVIDDLKNGFNSVSSVDMGKFRERPDEILFRQLCGCWVQCPFCNALCTNTMKGHDGDHRVHFHRPQGIAGWHPKGHDILIIDICTSSIVSDRTFRVSENNYHPYKSYKEAGPKYACWSITPDSSVQSYWKWFVCRFQRDLEKHYSKKFYGRGEIPKQWMTITKNEALQSLEEES
ncbi:GVIN1 GTPase, partial [Atractosteus spatula]|nr:GVIN1 GTPase [Atractosteus spatula]